MYRVGISRAALRAIFLLSAVALAPTVAAGQDPPPRLAKGDADGDGYSDLIMMHVYDDGCVLPIPAILRHYNGHVVWGRGGGVAAELEFRDTQAFGSTVWQVAATGDFDGDRVPDLFWEKLEGEGATLAQVRVDTKAVLTRGLYVAPDAEEPGDGLPDAEWAVVGTSDFAGIAPESGALASPDGQADLLWHNSLTGALGIWLSEAGVFRKANRFFLPGPGGDAAAVAVGDLDGDRLPEIVFVDPAGRLSYWKMAGTATVEIGELTPNQVLNPVSWKIGGAGDFDGNGTDDLVFWNVGSGKAVVWYMVAGSEGRGPTRIGGEFAAFESEDSDLLPRPKTDCDRWQVTGPR